MISRGRLSKSWLRVNKTKWCREARLRKTLYKPLNGSQTKGSQWENLLKKDKIKPFSASRSRQTHLLKIIYHLRNIKVLSINSHSHLLRSITRGQTAPKIPKGGNGKKIGLIFFPPGIISGIIRRGTERGGGVNFPVSGRSENCWQNGCNLTTRP